MTMTVSVRSVYVRCVHARVCNTHFDVSMFMYASIVLRMKVRQADEKKKTDQTFIYLVYFVRLTLSFATQHGTSYYYTKEAR